jgi:glyceraldehyde 3-phosphate dehydrogenase
VFENIIPSSTGAAKAVGKVIPSLNGKLTGMAMRIPSADVSVVDLTVELTQKTTYEAICEAMQQAAGGSLKRVLAYTDEKVVSTDFRGESAAGIFDADAGMMLDPTFVKIIGWYDNEYGYTCNLIRLTQYVAQYQSPMKSVAHEDVGMAEAVYY